MVTFEEMQKALGAASRATTFRYLKQVQYMRSYNHNGRYYTFRDPTRFDRWGLYAQGDIFFSRDGKLGNANKESIAQGTANIVNGFMGRMGGCAMIGQSIINIKSGGHGHLSVIVAALSLLLFILFGSAYIEMIPIAALVGLMFMVVVRTFAWSTFSVIDKIPLADALVILLVTALTVMFDLAIAVIAGVIVSALVFAWENALRIRARKHMDENGVKHYEIFGPLFFGSVQLFNSKFDVENDPDQIIIDFKESRVADHSGIEAINTLTRKYEQSGKKICLFHLSPDCRKLINKAEKLIHVDIMEDPEYTVVVQGFEDYST